MFAVCIHLLNQTQLSGRVQHLPQAKDAFVLLQQPCLPVGQTAPILQHTTQTVLIPVRQILLIEISGHTDTSLAEEPIFSFVRE